VNALAFFDHCPLLQRVFKKGEHKSLCPKPALLHGMRATPRNLAKRP
jgi:hypothetical protein